MKKYLKNLVDWQSLGLELGLLYPTLEKIELDHRGMVEQCKSKMLAAWLRQQDNVRQHGSPSWSVLQAALRSMGENRLASEISMNPLVSGAQYCVGPCSMQWLKFTLVCTGGG